VEGAAAAGLRIHPVGAARLAVSSRTFVHRFEGTFGFSIDGVPAASALALGGPTGTSIGLDQTTAKSGSRTNFGLTEVAGAAVFVQVTARSGDTGGVLATKNYFVPAFTSFQTSAADLLGAGVAASNFYLQFSVSAGAGRVVAYAASIDNISGDAIYVAAQ
jgi:hypothetical protein